MSAIQQVLSSYGSPATFVGPLDDYTADLAVVVDIKRRLLASYTGPACTVRADRTGQPQTDISYLSNGAWDEAALLSFAGSDSVYLVRPHDQYSLALDFTQATANKQPRLVNAGTLEPHGAWFNGTSHSLTASVADRLDVTGATSGQVYMRARVDSTSSDGKIFEMGGDVFACWLPYSGLFFWHWAYFSSRISGAIPAGVLNTLTDLSWGNDANSGQLRVANAVTNSGTEGGTITAGADSLSIFSEGGTFRFVEGWWSSLVMWKTGAPATCSARNTVLAAA